MNKQHSLWASLLLALVLTLGTAMIWSVVSDFCGDAIRQWQFRQRPLAELVNEFVLLAEKGTPLIGSFSIFDSRRHNFYRTLDGEHVESQRHLSSTPIMGPDALEDVDLPIGWSERIRGISDRETVQGFWYLIHDGRPEGHAWLEGFDSVTKQRVGYIGRHGFRTAPPTREDLFPVDWDVFQTYAHVRSSVTIGGVPYRSVTAKPSPGDIPPWVVYLISNGKLVEIDVRERRVRTLLEEASLISAVVVPHSSKDATNRFFGQVVAVRSTDRLWIIDPCTKRTQQYAIPDPFRRSTFGIFVVDDQILLTNDRWSARGEPVMLVWLSQDGRVLEEHSVSLRSIVYPQRSDWAHVAMLPVPIALALDFFLRRPLDQLRDGTAATYSQALTASWRRYRAPFVALCLLSIALAVWCFWRHRRYAQAGAWAWCGFVLLLGVPGLVGYLLHRRWPVHEPCPACGRPAVVDRDTCQHCRVAFPTPELQGIEVFD